MATFDGNNAVTNTAAAVAGNAGGHTGVLVGSYAALGEVARDSTPPSIYNFAPSTGNPIGINDAISFDIEDTDPGVALTAIRIRVKYASRDETVLVFDGSAFLPPYDVSSSITGDVLYWNVTVNHNYGWPDEIESFTVDAIDSDGNSASEAITLTVPDADPGAPTITVVSPTPGVAPGGMGGFPADPDAAAATPIVLDVVDTYPGNRLVIVTARFLGVDAEEVVYRRGQFRGNYISGSAQATITDGVRLTCLRDGGWPGAPTFNVEAVDTAGNLAS